MTTGDMSQALGDLSTQPRPSLARRERRIDPRIMGAGSGVDGARGGFGGQAGRAGEELGQFQSAPVARQKAEPRRPAEATLLHGPPCQSGQVFLDINWLNV